MVAVRTLQLLNKHTVTCNTQYKQKIPVKNHVNDLNNSRSFITWLLIHVLDNAIEILVRRIQTCL
jgi:hypothetical protein